MNSVEDRPSTAGGRYHRPIPGAPQSPTPSPSGSDAALSTLRGAAVTVDARRVGRVAAFGAMVALLAAALVLFAAGANKNAQLDELHQHGVAVEMTVTRCVGLLGGSGSNAAGYACQGTYTFRGHRYDAPVPGSVRRSPGSTLQVVVSSQNPALVSTPAALAESHPSWRVFLTPGALTLVALALGALAFRRWRPSGPSPRRSGAAQAGGV